MGDNKVTKVPAINHKRLEVTQEITGDDSDMQSINVSEKVKSYQSSVGSPRDSKESKILSEGGDAVKVAKEGKVTKAKSQLDKTNIDTISSSQRHKYITGSIGVNHYAQRIRGSSIKLPTSHKNQGIKTSVIGVPVLPFQQSRTEQMRTNAATLAQRSASTGNLTTTGTTCSTSSPTITRKEISGLGQSPLVNSRSIVNNQSPRPFRKGTCHNVTSKQSGLFPAKHETAAGKATETKPPTKPAKATKPLSLSQRRFAPQQTLRKESPTINNQKVYVCSNGIKLGPGTILKLPAQRVRPVSPKSRSPSPRSPRSPTAKHRTSFTLPTSSSLAKTKERGPGRNLQKPVTKDTVKLITEYSTKQSDKISCLRQMHADSTCSSLNSNVKSDPKNSLMKEANTNKTPRGHQDSHDSCAIVLKDLQDLSITLENTKSEKVTSCDLLLKETEEACCELEDMKIKTVTSRDIMTDNNMPSGKSYEMQHDKKNMSSMMQAFDDIELHDSALHLNTKLEQENAKMMDIYFSKLKVEKEHNYAKLPSNSTSETLKAASDINCIGENKQTVDSNVIRELQIEESKPVRVDSEEKLCDTSRRSTMTWDNRNNGTDRTLDAPSAVAMSQSEEETIKQRDLKICSISAKVSSKADENLNEVSFITPEVEKNGANRPIIKTASNTHIPEVKISSGSIPSEKAHNGSHIPTEEPLGSKPNGECIYGNGTDLMLSQSKTCLDLDIEAVADNEISSFTAQLPKTCTTDSCDSDNDITVKIEKTVSDTLPDMKKAIGNEPEINAIRSYFDSEETANGTHNECDDYEAIVDKVLWTDDIESEKQQYETRFDSKESDPDFDDDDNDGPTGLASSISMFFEAYESQLKIQGSEHEHKPANKVQNHSPPYIAGLSPVSNSSHQLRVPGSSHCDRPFAGGLGGFRSRSNSWCNETILEERESQSSDDEEAKEVLGDTPGFLKNIPGKADSFQSNQSSSYTECSIFQSESSEDDVRISINLDDWWQTWTMGRQRSQPDDNHDTSDLEKVKVITSRMNLSSRRPSTLEWKEKYMDKPPFLWNYVAGKPPVLSPSSSETEVITQHKAKCSDWTDERVEKVNEAISWIRTELVRKHTHLLDK